jgi:hypothetical protein
MYHDAIKETDKLGITNKNQLEREDCTLQKGIIQYKKRNETKMTVPPRHPSRTLLLPWGR